MLPTWEDIQVTICRRCIDGDGRGNCRLPVDERCTLQTSFPLLVETVSRTHAPDLEGYIHALRTTVCASCMHQDGNGNCWKRNRLECALDRYYPFVIGLIERHMSPAYDEPVGR